MGERHPKAGSHLLDHLLEVEAMFDVCIVSGFSMGIPNAILAAISGPMLHDNVGVGMGERLMVREFKEYGNSLL